MEMRRSAWLNTAPKNPSQLRTSSFVSMTTNKEMHGVANDDQEEDAYDARIQKTGCQEENDNLLICYADKKDWRLCSAEMQAFRNCYQKNKRNAGSQELEDSEHAKK